jgi:hypothetical protein
MWEAILTTLPTLPHNPDKSGRPGSDGTKTKKMMFSNCEPWIGGFPVGCSLQPTNPFPEAMDCRWFALESDGNGRIVWLYDWVVVSTPLKNMS